MFRPGLSCFKLIPSGSERFIFQHPGKIVTFFQEASIAKMPKSKTKKTGNSKEAAVTEISGPVVENKDNSFTLHIQAKPGAKQNAITDISEESIGVQIAAPPVDGEANKELVKYLSKTFSLRKSDVCLEKGSKSRIKSIKIISDCLTKENILETLKRKIGE